MFGIPRLFARDLHDDICQQLVYVSATINELKHSSGRVKDPQTQQAFARLEKETNTIFDSITGALAKAEKVELRGFGSFRVRRRNARRGRNPKTGSGVSVPEKRVPFFKVGKRLKELVNG